MSPRQSEIEATSSSDSGSNSDSSSSSYGASVELRPLVVTNPDEESDLINKQPQRERGHGGGHGHGAEPGTASKTQVAVNIFISFVGSGMLGMPYAFSQAGWLLSIVSLATISVLNIYAMLLLCKTRGKLESMGHTGIEGYGDVGRVLMGDRGEKFVNMCLCISQVGFATAYIIFIATNLTNIANINRAYVCFGCVPFLAYLVQIQDMKHLSPFSLIADVANLSGLFAVLFQDYQTYRVSHEAVILGNFSKVLYVSSVALYSLEGVGMVLSLEASCADRKWFPTLLKQTLFGITSLMAVFGCCGYFAFGSETQAPITLNLEGNWATVVKLALCVGLYLTFPIMMFPVNEVMEDIFVGDGSRPNRVFRTFVVVLSALIAYLLPDFGKFLGLVGASICTILGFILPCFFHLKAFDRTELAGWEYLLDIFLIGFGIAFGVTGTYDSFVDLMNDGGGGHL